MATRNKAERATPPSRIPASAWLMGLILLGAVGLRMVRLGYALLWIDELDVLWNSRSARGPLDVIVYTIRNCFEIPTNEQMPFQYAWLKIFLALYQVLDVEPGAALVRLPFALLGCLSVGLLYPAVRRWYDRETAGWTLGLVAISYFHVYQSRDATSYNPLLFFIALHLYGLGGWLRPEGPRPGDRVAFLAGAIGMLMSHLSAWLFLAPEGLLWLGRAAWQRARGPKRRAWRYELLGGPFEPAALLVLCALPFLIVLYRAITIFKPPGLKEEVEITTFSLPFLRYQLAHFGWGLGAGRLTGFVLALLGGLVSLMGNHPHRARAAAHVVLLVTGVMLLFWAPHAVIYPRYLTITFLPLLVLAGRGLAWWRQRLGRALPARLAWAPAAAAAALLVAGHVRPLAQLLALRAKLMPVPQLVEWLETRLPENGLYVWESGYNLRDVPGAYPVRGRQPAFATMHSGSIRVSPVAEQLGPFARSIFQRFPLAVLLATGFPEPPDSGPWAWIGTDFAHREVIRNEGLESLHRYGFSPHGFRYPANLNIVCYFNRPEDLPARLASDGRPFLAYPDGHGWRYVQTRDGLLFASPDPVAALRVRNLSGETLDAQVVVEGAVQATGNLRVAGPGGVAFKETMQAAGQMRRVVGRFSFPPGDQDVQVEFSPAGRNALLVYAFHVVPLSTGTPRSEETK